MAVQFIFVVSDMTFRGILSESLEVSNFQGTLDMTKAYRSLIKSLRYPLNHDPNTTVLAKPILLAQLLGYGMTVKDIKEDAIQFRRECIVWLDAFEGMQRRLEHMERVQS